MVVNKKNDSREEKHIENILKFLEITKNDFDIFNGKFVKSANIININDITEIPASAGIDKKKNKNDFYRFLLH